MTRDRVLEELIEVLVEEFEVDKDEIHPDADIFEDLDLDSLDAIDLVVNMDKQLGVALKGEDAQKVRTIEDFIQLVLSKA